MIPSPGRKVMVLASTNRKRDIPIGSIGYISHTYNDQLMPLNRRQTQHLKEYGAFIKHYISTPKVKQCMDVVFSRMGRNKQCIRRKNLVNIVPDFETIKNIKDMKTFLKSVNTVRKRSPEKNIVVLCDIDTPISMDDMSFNELASLLYSLVLFVTKNHTFYKVTQEYFHGNEREHADSVIDRIDTDRIILTKKSWKMVRTLTWDLEEGPVYKRALYKEHILPTIVALRAIIGQLQAAHIRAKIANTMVQNNNFIYTTYFLPKEMRDYLKLATLSFGNAEFRQKKIKQMDRVKDLLRSLSTEQ